MHQFFEHETTKEQITDYLKSMLKIKYSDDFEKLRNGYIFHILESMVKNAREWDENTQFNITKTSKNLRENLTAFENDTKDRDSLDRMFVLLFRFYSEFQLYKATEEFDHYSEMRKFARNNIGAFSTTCENQINYTLLDMPTSILKHLLSNQDFSTLRDFLKLKNQATKLKLEWEADLKVREEEVNKFKTSLESYKDGFNFVALYDGFKGMGKAKDKELKAARYLLLSIGIIIPAVIGFGLWHIINLKEHMQSIYDLVMFIPATAMSLVLIYYFRISLLNYNSIRAQKMQIELRKSLCQFIQDYSKYSSQISKENAGLLTKFEEVIFSNIMTSEDKIPSTFDGLEQIATLIKAVKTKSG